MAKKRQEEASPTHIRDLIADPQNRRSHNPRNIGMVVDALQKVGAARSIVIDEDNVVLAGNGVTEAAAEAGMTKLQVVDVDGETLVAVRRRGLTKEQKRALAIYDNRSAELAEWNLEQLQADHADGLDLEAFWSDAEIGRLLAEGAGAKPETVLDQAVQMRPQREYVLVMCAEGEAGAAEFERLKAALELGLVRRGGYRHGSAFDAVGTQRVVTAAALLERLEGMRTNGEHRDTDHGAADARPV